MAKRSATAILAIILLLVPITWIVANATQPDAGNNSRGDKGLVSKVSDLRAELDDLKAQIQDVRSRTQYYIWNAGTEEFPTDNKAEGNHEFTVPEIPENAQVFFKVNSKAPIYFTEGGHGGGKMYFQYRDWNNNTFDRHVKLDYVIVVKK
jgi:hypothetical protein